MLRVYLLRGLRKTNHRWGAWSQPQAPQTPKYLVKSSWAGLKQPISLFKWECGQTRQDECITKAFSFTSVCEGVIDLPAEDTDTTTDWLHVYENDMDQKKARVVRLVAEKRQCGQRWRTDQLFYTIPSEAAIQQKLKTTNHL